MATTNMTASQAKAQATIVARREAAKKSSELKKRRAALKVSVPKIRAERIKKIEAQFRERIKYRVEDGDRKAEITLSEDNHDCLRGEWKYLPQRRTTDYRGQPQYSYYHAWGEGYLKYAPWGKYVKLVLAKLRKDGYKCVVVGESVEHDDSSAYMNSGGECGSEKPYWTRNTILTISW